MKNRLKTSLFAAASLIFTSLGASGNPLTFQGVTFNLVDLGSGVLELTIDNALNGGTGNWTNINYLEAFAVKPTNNSYTGASVPGWHEVNGGLNGSAGLGCDGAGAGFRCFNQLTTPVTLTDHMVFDIAFTGGTGALGTTTLKVDFWTTANQNVCTGIDSKGVSTGCTGTGATGDLLSKDIGTAVPSPIVGAGLPGLIVACGGLLGLARRRRQKIA